MENVKEYSTAYRIRLALIGLIVFLVHGAKLYSDVDFTYALLNNCIFMKYLLGNSRFNPYFTSIITLVMFMISVSAFLFMWDRMGGSLTGGQAVSSSYGQREASDLWAW